MTKHKSKIDKLISELCPNGVDFKLLCEVATIKHGKDYKSLGVGDVPVYGSGGIMTHVDKYSFDKPSVLIPSLSIVLCKRHFS